MTSKLKNSSNYNVEYRDGIKSKGDKIGMPCTQALYCRRGTQLRSGVHVVEIHVPSVWRLVCLS